MIGGRTGGTQLRKRSVGAQWIGIGSSVACNNDYEYILLYFQCAQWAPPNLVIIVFLVTNRIGGGRTLYIRMKNIIDTWHVECSWISWSVHRLSCRHPLLVETSSVAVSPHPLPSLEVSTLKHVIIPLSWSREIILYLHYVCCIHT